MSITLAILAGAVLDLILGDPVIPYFPHPVVIMGRVISWSEKRLRKVFPKTEKGEKRAGLVLAIALPVSTLIVTYGLYFGLRAVHPALGFAVQVLWCWQSLAMRDLIKESRNVYKTLKSGDISASRSAVGRIVGRDTDRLDDKGIIRATVETVSENFSDGVFAPLFYMLIGSAPLGMVYKSVNTMDSMVGYKNEKYLHFGRAAAKLDDAANLIPSRLGALFWILASGIAGEDIKGAWKIWRRDRRKHSSPNSAQCESACAGALGIHLGGPSRYFGELYDKPTIGDDTRLVEAEDILRADRIMTVAGIAALTVGLALRFVILR
jgi:adenosylcobinamide-phosphate synthase